jgi:hypothetical protein
MYVHTNPYVYIYNIYMMYINVYMFTYHHTKELYTAIKNKEIMSFFRKMEIIMLSKSD